METGTAVIGILRVLRIAAGGGIVLSLIGWLHFQTFVWLYERYTAADSYYSHGFIVPAVTCALIWLKRKRLLGVPVSVNYAGLVICCAALAVHAAGLLFRVYFASGFSLFFLVIGSILFLFGAGITRRIFMPLLFLVFMLPLPLVAVNSVSFPLKTLVAVNTTAILKYMCGLPIRIEGFQIIFPQASLTIENPCSGLRSIIVMLALGFIFSYLSDATRGKKLLIFLFSIPVAVISNILRVLLLSIAVYVYGERMAQGFFHDLTGYCAFALSLVCMHGFWRMFQCRN